MVNPTEPFLPCISPPPVLRCRPRVLRSPRVRIGHSTRCRGRVDATIATRGRGAPIHLGSQQRDGREHVSAWEWAFCCKNGSSPIACVMQPSEFQYPTRSRDQCLSENVCMELDPKVLDLDITKNMNKNLGNVSVLFDFWPMEMKSFSCENASNYTCREQVHRGISAPFGQVSTKSVQLIACLSCNQLLKRWFESPTLAYVTLSAHSAWTTVPSFWPKQAKSAPGRSARPSCKIKLGQLPPCSTLCVSMQQPCRTAIETAKSQLWRDVFLVWIFSELCPDF